MKDANLKRVFNRLCRKRGFDDSPKSFAIFKAGVDYANGDFEPMATGEMSQSAMFNRMVEEANKIDLGGE